MMVIDDAWVAKGETFCASQEQNMTAFNKSSASFIFTPEITGNILKKLGHVSNLFIKD